MHLNKLQELGFDASTHIPFTKWNRIRCPQCNAITINGHPVHEFGCPNQKYECQGCNAIIDYIGYCSNCQ